MSDCVTARQMRRGAGTPALIVALALMLAGCASADAPLPFITSPDPETTATTTPAEPAANEAPAAPQPTAGQGAPAADAATPAQPAAAHSAATAQPAANGSSATPPTQPHSPTRQDLPFPSFATPTPKDQRPVMTDAEKAKMQSDLEALAKSRETKMRQDIEQAQ